MDGRPHEAAAVHRLLREHIEEHRRLPESARLRDLGSEKALVQDYSGRVVYELLQNALDRASGHILVRWDSQARLLEVANDGMPVTVESVGGKRSDLRALLSLHTSSKSAEESIGNKGVGFRSVFGAGREVEVWSRSGDGSWWGMRMRHPTRPIPPVDTWSDQEIASFYAPEPLFADADEHRDHVTVIRLRDVERPETVASISRSVEELQRGPLTFLERRAPPGMRITLRRDATEVTHTLGRESGVTLQERRLDVPPAVRASTGLDLQSAEVRVLVQSKPNESRYWSYLPTEQAAGFGVQVHGDFYLSNSRRNLALRRLTDGDAASDPAGWNATLVDLAAECILELWQMPEVCAADHFWEFATPRACVCPHLKDAVARRLWKDAAVFETMVRLAFPVGRIWPVGRYRRFFDALDAWADYAFRNLDWGPLYRRRHDLLDRVQSSGAPVLPIITGDPSVEGDLPLEARPLVAGVQGQRRGTDTDRIYFRRHDPVGTVDLPPEVRRQRTFVTTFSPGLDVPLARQGLLEFDRPEILAQLQPGRDPHEHGALLAAAVDLARQESRGGLGALSRRAEEFAVGAAWRFVAKETIARAGRSLAGLFIRTCDGAWVPAGRCGRARGPWPRVDEEWLSAASPDGALSADDVCLLLGIGPLPLDDAGVPSFPEELPEETMVDLIGQWPFLAGFLRREEGQAAREALEKCRWLRAIDGVDILAGVGGLAPYAPVELWWQYPNRGFRTALLPRLVVEPSGRPEWAMILGVSNPQEATSRRRLLNGFERLRHLEPRSLDEAGQRDLIELYRNLTDRMLGFEEPSAVPLLYRDIADDGTTRGLIWGNPEDGIWHDTGSHTTALHAFTGVRVWVVRKAPLKRAALIGLRNFAPEPPRIGSTGVSDDALACGLQGALSRAMPDLLAAGCASYNEFRAEDALEAFAGLAVRHFEDVWVEWSFDGKHGSLGRNEGGDVLGHQRDDGGKELWFDGSRIPLIECAFPLSELLSDSRGFGAVFKDGLIAWSTARDGQSTSVQRFRREHGLSVRDVEYWRTRVDALTLGAADRLVWASQVKDALLPFGGLKGEPAPGMVLQPESFECLCHSLEDDVAKALETVPVLRPRVDFAGPNRLRLDTHDRTQAIAAAAEERRGWTEELLRTLRTLADTPLPEEDEATRWLDFDPRAALCARLGLPVSHPQPGAAALAFARGQIPLAALPDSPAELTLKRFTGDGVDMEARDPQTEDQILRDARRKATGGRRAEEAVLNLAMSDALVWRREDPAAFGEALRRLLPLLGDKGAERALEAGSERGMRALLHVADYVGNAGFDVLVPRGGAFLLVEVKRVARLRDAAFFLSENERRRAARYKALGHDWRLWLVTGSGEPLDATRALAPFATHAESLDCLAKDGLRPGEWFFVLDD